MDSNQNKLLPQPCRQQEPNVLAVVSLWSVVLLVTFGLTAGLSLGIAPKFLMVIFPKGKFMGFLYFGMPWILISMWCVGTILAYRRHRSWRVVMGLILAGVVVVSTFPIWFYLTVLMLAGGWDVGK